MCHVGLVLLALAQLPVSPDPKPIAISGVVVDRSDSGAGRSVANADVWLFEALSPDEGWRSGMEVWWSNLTQPSEGTTEVLVHARTDASGSFTLNVPAEAVARRSPRPLAIWAMAPGSERRLAVRRLPRIVLADDPPVRLEIGPPVRAEMTVQEPGGKPVAAAKVVPTRAADLPFPDPLRHDLAATTDEHGRAVLPGLARETLDEVRIEAPGFGTQIIRTPHSQVPIADSRVNAVTLAPVGRITGRLVAPGNELVPGVTIHATTQGGGYAGSGTVGLADVACDAQGRFEIAAIAEGTLTLRLEFDPEHGTLLRGETPKRLVVATGKTTELAVPLRRTLKVQGLVREKGTKRPIAGVKVALNGNYGGDHFAVTDAKGKFAGRIVRELIQPYGWPVRIPTPFYYPTDQAEAPQGMPRRGSEELVLPPTELPRGVDVQGVVAGESNTGVPGAIVEAFWTVADGMAQAALARTDRSGSFTFHGIDPLAEVSLRAWDAFASTKGAVTVRVEAARAKPVALTISPRNCAPVGGRVVDPAGQGIAGASVRIWREVQDKNGRAIVIDPVRTDDGAILVRSDADGRYRAAGRVPLQGIYYAEATATKRLSARSAQITLTERTQELPALVLRGVRTMIGQVVDHQGNPVQRATVRQSGDGPLSTKTLSDEQGRFRLPGVLEGTALVFAEKQGFRIQFDVIDDERKPVRIVLAGTGEPPAVIYRTLPAALPVDEEKALARQVFQPYAEKVLDHGKDEEKFRFLVDAAAIDPFAALERIDTVKFTDADYLKAARGNLVEALASESLDDATALIEASPDADSRAQSYVRICDARCDLGPDRTRDLLAQATLNARNMKSGPDRVTVSARIANHWLDVGETDRARALLSESLELGKSTAEGNNGRGYELGIVAETLARLDLPAALKVLDDLARDVRKSDTRDRGYVFDRFHGRIAYKLAAQSPEGAEHVLERIPVTLDRDRYVVAVCAKMAPKDLPRARRIAEAKVSPDAPAYRPYALGVMAQALAGSDKPVAIGLVEDAYAGLEELARNGERRFHPDLVQVAAGLLPIVEEIEPNRLAEFLARTLALRPPRGDQTDLYEAGIAGTTAALAMMVARYDRALAASLLEPELRKTGTYQGLFGSDYVTWRIMAAEALIDPRRAVRLVEALPDDPGAGTDSTTTKNQARIEIAKLLALHGADRWQYVYQNFLYLWTPQSRYL